MPRVRPNGAQRWAQRTAAATPDYQAGIAAPRVSWQQATVASADAHKAAVTEALAKGRFAQGVQRAGDAKWQRNAQGKGADRFGPGAAAGVEDYTQGVQKYLQVIEGTQLPPRGPKGDPRNIQRVAVLAAALRKAKTGSVSFALVLALGLASLIEIGMGFVTRKLQTLEPPAAIHRNAIQPHGPRVTGMASVVGLVGIVAAVTLMGAALDTVSASVTAAAVAPGGSGMAAVAGDSLNVRNCPINLRPLLLQMWVKSQTSGIIQMTHPTGNDTTRDIRGRHVATAALPLLTNGYSEPMEPQEAMTLTLSAGAVAGDIELWHALMYYPELPGTNANLIDLNGLDARFVEYVTVEDTTTATGGGVYSGARLINAASDLLIANTDYALLGAHIGALCGALCVQGSDFGNLRLGIPGMNGRPDVTANWFPWLTQEYGIPLIPVFNSANKGNITITNVQDENLTAVPFALVLARLSE